MLDLNFKKPIPVNKEVSWDKSQVLMSRTDSKGTIIDVNEHFVTISGYTKLELIGRPHSIIRHPEMPQIIFRALWDNLKAGRNFIGVIKNMAKSGEYYWIFTFFEFLKEPSGEMSYLAKRAAVPQEVVDKHIEPLYESLLKLEKIGGMELSSRFFKNYLTRQNKSYMEYVMELIENGGVSITAVGASAGEVSAPQDTNISDDIYAVSAKEEEKRKSMFSKFFQ